MLTWPHEERSGCTPGQPGLTGLPPAQDPCAALSMCRCPHASGSALTGCRIALTALESHPKRVRSPEEADVIFVNDWCLVARTMADVHAKQHWCVLQRACSYAALRYNALRAGGSRGKGLIVVTGQGKRCSSTPGKASP